MRDHARAMLWFAAAGVAVLAGVSASGGRAQADDPNSAPNPYHVVEHWAKLPEGRVWGQAIGADIDRDGTSLWVFDRCAAKTCEGSNVAPIQKFDASGHLVASFGRTTASKFSIRMENSWRNGNSSVAQAACTSAMT